MKLISLNIWGGKLFEPLVEFVKRESKDTDIFCFQEVFHAPGETKPLPSGARADMFTVFERTLPDFKGYFANEEEGWDFEEPVSFPIAYGQVSFVRKTFAVPAHRQIHITENAVRSTEDPFDHPRVMQCLEIQAGTDAPLHIFNLHGLLDPARKYDSEVRLAQFARVRKEIDAAGNRVILCGDFNVRPETKSVALFEKDMRNLLKEYGMPVTRNSQYPGMEKYDDRWGDYIFATKDIVVDTFTVLNDIVSDHLPLSVELG